MVLYYDSQIQTLPLFFMNITTAILWGSIKKFLVFHLLTVFYHSLYQQTKIFYQIIVVMLRTIEQLKEIESQQASHYQRSCVSGTERIAHLPPQALNYFVAVMAQCF